MIRHVTQQREKDMKIFNWLFGKKDKGSATTFVNKPARSIGHKGELGEALCNAAESGDIVEVTRLLAQGAEPNYETGPKRASPLLFAALNGWTEVVRMLISAGGSINKQNTDGLTPLMAAAMNGHVEVVKVLCDNNADLNVQGLEYKFTALMLTVIKKQTDAFKVLLDRGANVTLRNALGETVLEMAENHKANEISTLLASSKKGNIADPVEERIRNLKELQLKLFISNIIY